MMLTQQRLKELLHYNPDTGIFSRMATRGGTAREGTTAGTISSNGYVRIKVDNKLYSAHRLAFLYMLGKLPQYQVDHINHIRTDNSFTNLREVRQQENQHNRSMSKNNKTGVEGVSWDRGKNKFRVDLYLNNHCVYIGRYTTIEEAKKARDNAKIQLHPTSPETWSLSMRSEF